MSRVRIATRGSRLALAQSAWVARRLEALLGVASELVPIKTSGDRLAQGPLAPVGGKGLFVKEIEEALLEGRADLAVHSTKDLPARLPAGLVLAAFPERADPRDALVTRRPGQTLATLPPGSRVGTGSVRRTAQLRAWRPDLRVEPLRGNVPTRLARLDEGRFDALVLACAGLDRLGLADRIQERIDPGRLLPAVGQGALALETRADAPLARELAPLADPATEAAVRAERAFLVRLEGDCDVPLAALAEPRGAGRVRVRGLVASLDGARIARADREESGPQAAGEAAAQAVLAAGGAEILAALRREAGS